MVYPTPEVSQREKYSEGNEGKPMEKEGKGFRGKLFPSEEEAVKAHCSPPRTPAHIQRGPFPDKALKSVYVPVDKAYPSEFKGETAYKVAQSPEGQGEEENIRHLPGLFLFSPPYGYEGKAHGEKQAQKAYHSSTSLKNFWLRREL